MLLAPLTLTLTLLGCNSDRPSLAKVSGRVTLDDKPLPKGTIIFEPTGQRSAVGRIEDGAIVELTTYDPGDGATLGHHSVAISSTGEAAGGPAEVVHPGEAKKPSANYMSGTSLIPTRYNDPATSGLSAEIEPGKNSVEFRLSSKLENR